MKPILYRKSALDDLELLARYFDAIHPEITIQIVADVQSSVGRLMDYPLSGEAIAGTALRRIVSRRYRFTISYLVAPDQVEIVGVFRHQNRDA